MARKECPAVDGNGRIKSWIMHEWHIEGRRKEKKREKREGKEKREERRKLLDSYLKMRG